MPIVDLRFTIENDKLRIKKGKSKIEDRRSKTSKCTVHFEPSGLKIEVPAGTVLLEAARKAGIYLSSICGGDGYCGKCKVTIDEGQFQTRPTTLLTPDEIRENVVLACQTKTLSDMTVTVPKSHALQASQILMDDATPPPIYPPNIPQNPSPKISSIIK